MFSFLHAFGGRRREHLSRTRETAHGAGLDGEIETISRGTLALRILIVLGALAAALALAWLWLSPTRVETMVVKHLAISPGPLALDDSTRLLGFLISMLPMSVLFYALYEAFRLLSDVARGQVFTGTMTVRLRRIGLAVIALGLVRPLSAALVGVALTSARAPGARELAIGVSFDDYMIALFGGLILILAQVMLQATRLADEHRQIV
jgi:hypothetical protein